MATQTKLMAKTPNPSFEGILLMPGPISEPNNNRKKINLTELLVLGGLSFPD